MLLLKSKKEFKTIRKISKNYLLFHFFGFVDKENNVTHYTSNPLAFVVRAKDLVDEDIRLFGKKRWEKLDKNTNLIVYQGAGLTQFEQPISLEKQVRGMRYATQEEEKIIKTEIVKQEAKRLQVKSSDCFYNRENYQELYKFCMSNDLQEYLFSLERHMELESI